MHFNPILFSPLPYVRLADPTAPPAHGGIYPRNNYCSKKLKNPVACHEFYRALAQDPAIAQGVLRQCPHGFAAYAFLLSGEPMAFTGIVPFPRLGGELERQRAKDHPEAKISQAYLFQCARALAKGESALQEAVIERLKLYPSALHEIRKYNRTIKQEAERLCMASSPEDIDKAPASLVCILKSSELMTYQFEILELIANEDLASLPPNTRADVYRLFDKCTRICHITAQKKNIRLDINGDSIQAVVCDKTFPIIATVLLENAVKYSLKNTTINVRVKRAAPATGEVSVTNIAPAPPHSDVTQYFQKWSRGKQDGSGMGFGLYLAQLVAKQHGATISVHTVPQPGNPMFHTWAFTLRLPIIALPSL